MNSELFAVTPTWADRFPSIWKLVQRWGMENFPPWGVCAESMLVAVERRSNFFVFRLQRDQIASVSVHRWHITFSADGRPLMSGEGWKIEGNDVDVEILKVPVPWLEVAA